MNLPPPIPLEEAQRRLHDAVEPLGAEAVSTAETDGRYLAEDIHARRTQPAADLSAMDGYAVCADNLTGPWNVVGESAAGHPFASELLDGQAVRISTGALMPDGGDAVLLQENCTRTGDAITLTDADGPTPRHIRRKGFDFRDGDALLQRGQMLNPARIALALSGGHGEVPVGRLPSLAIVDSGDELSDDPANLAVHQIPASNGVMLAAMARPFASTITRLGPVADTMDAMLSAFDRAADADVIVTSGGASVGDHDLVRPALEQWGATIDFWRIAMKPGKPLLFARRGRQMIIGLPGNPVSGYVTAFLLLLPLLRYLSGAASPLPAAMQLELASDLPPIGKRLEFVRARIESGRAHPVIEQDSSALLALSASNGLIRREIGAGAAKAGDSVLVYPLQNGGIA